MLKNPNSLWIKILKARYSPDSSFLKAFKGSRASWGWSSLLDGLKVLKKGCCWKIRDGKLVKILDHKWILELHKNNINTKPPSFDNSVTYVVNLINPSRKVWQLDPIVQWLSPLEMPS